MSVTITWVERNPYFFLKTTFVTIRPFEIFYLFRIILVTFLVALEPTNLIFLGFLRDQPASFRKA